MFCGPSCESRILSIGNTRRIGKTGNPAVSLTRYMLQALANAPGKLHELILAIYLRKPRIDFGQFKFEDGIMANKDERKKVKPI